MAPAPVAKVKTAGREYFDKLKVERSEQVKLALRLFFGLFLFIFFCSEATISIILNSYSRFALSGDKSSLQDVVLMPPINICPNYDAYTKTMTTITGQPSCFSIFNVSTIKKYQPVPVTVSPVTIDVMFTGEDVNGPGNRNCFQVPEVLVATEETLYCYVNSNGPIMVTPSFKGIEYTYTPPPFLHMWLQLPYAQPMNIVLDVVTSKLLNGDFFTKFIPLPRPATYLPNTGATITPFTISVTPETLISLQEVGLDSGWQFFALFGGMGCVTYAVYRLIWWILCLALKWEKDDKKEAAGAQEQKKPGAYRTF
eukprot:CAMPEP_0113897652 /NCGR_PEP_ID=MMETSP0780_2-20120614/18842_1 /TAXON_ID=652834 /ORGANISM="Palpitomonas bilix" /LENGTH=310 /DNA_ID=CAMNT_0000889227 /DNA_START=18 /DNA_END=950 /DNA_ORIENTATION=- /assembly_acc=CAM_ASM_000599